MTTTAGMTRQHFQLIAAVLRENHDWPRVGHSLAHEFADELAATNTRFDRARFLRACGVEA